MVASRSYYASIKEYESLINKKFIETPQGESHLEILKEIDPSLKGACITPLFDFCNHLTPEGPEQKHGSTFSITFKQGGVLCSIDKEFKKNQDYEYSYQPVATNENLIFSYGFYIKNNPQSLTKIVVPISKKFFPIEKYEVCAKLNCFDGSLDHIYKDNRILNFQIDTYINRFYLKNGILNVVRLLILPNENIDRDVLYKKLKKGHILNYDNEMLSLAYMIKSIQAEISRPLLKFVKINFFM